MKVKLKRRLVPLFLAGWSFIVTIAETKAASFPQLNSTSIKCIKTGSPNTCRLALTRAEALQREAASRKNYSCQTYALGLGADLIMVSRRNNRSSSAYEMIEKIQKNC